MSVKNTELVGLSAERKYIDSTYILYKGSLFHLKNMIPQKYDSILMTLQKKMCKQKLPSTS